MSENMAARVRRHMQKFAQRVQESRLRQARHDLAQAYAYISLAADRLFEQYQPFAEDLYELAHEVEKHIRILTEAENEACASK